MYYAIELAFAYTQLGTYVVLLKILLKYEHCKWLPKQFFWPQKCRKKTHLNGISLNKRGRGTHASKAAFSLFSWQWADFCVKSMHVIIILHPVAKLMGRCFLNAFFHNTYYTTIECETKNCHLPKCDLSVLLRRRSSLWFSHWSIFILKNAKLINKILEKCVRKVSAHQFCHWM